MLNKKGMLAKLFSAVLALGMVIQPVTPLTSPIIVFAEGEGDTTPDPVVSPETTPTPGTQEPGNDDGNQTPDGETGNQGSGNTGTGDQGDGQQGGSGESGGTETPANPGDNGPEETTAIVKAEYDEESGTITVAALEGANEQEVANFFAAYDLELVATVATNGVTLDRQKIGEFVETTDQDTNEITATVNYSAIFVEDSHVKVSNLSVVVKDAADETLNAKIDNTTLKGVEKEEDKRETSATFESFENENEGYGFKAVVSNPKKGQQYQLQLRDGTGAVVTQSDWTATKSPFEKLPLSLDSGFKFDIDYTPVVVSNDGTVNVNGSTKLRIDAPKYESISWMTEAETEYAVVKFNKKVFWNVYLYLNRTANGVTEYIRLEDGELFDTTTTQNSYRFALRDISGDNTNLEKYGAGTTYSFIDRQSGSTVAKVVLTSTEDKNKEYVIDNLGNGGITRQDKPIDTVPPRMTNIDWSDNSNLAKTKDNVTATVTFNEPLKNAPVLFYTINDGDPATPNSVTGVYNSDKDTYIFTFTGEENVTGDLPQEGQKYSVISYTAEDNKHSYNGVLENTKEFTIDKVGPTVNSEGFTFNDESGNPVVTGALVNSNVTITLSFDEEVVNPTISYKEDGEEKTASLTKDSNSSNYTYTFDVGESVYHRYTDFSFNATDNAGNPLDSSAISGLIPTEFMVDKVKPSISIDQYIVDKNGEELDAVDSNIVLTGKEFIGLNISVDDAESGLDLDNSPIEFLTEDSEGQIIPIESVVINRDRGVVYNIRAQQSLSNVIVRVHDKAGNVNEYRWTRPLIIEDKEPEISPLDIPEDLTNGEYQSYTIGLDVTDQKDSKVISSGIKSITYSLTKDGKSETFDNGLNPAEMSSSYSFYSFENDAPTINDLVYSQSGRITVSSYEGNKLSGLYDLTVTVEDNSGNTSSVTEKLKFDVDAPVVEISNKDVLEVTNTKHAVEFKAHDEPAEANDQIANIYLWLTDAEGNRKEFTNADGTTDSVRTLAADATSYTIDCKDLNGVFTVHMSAVDQYGNGINPVEDETAVSTDTAVVKFDNTKPEVEVTADNSDSRKNHTVNFTITEKPDTAYSGIDNVKYWLTNSTGAVVEFEEGKELDGDNKYTYFTATDEEVLGQIDTSVEEDNYASIEIKDTVGLNGIYTLYVSASDKLNPDEYTEKSVDLIFDNTAPELSSNLSIDNEEYAEQIHTVSFNISDGPENYSSKIATVEYWLTKQGSEEKKAFDTTLGVLNGDKVAVVNADSLGDVANPDNAKLDNKSFEATIQSPSTGEKLNGEYVLHVVIKDNAGNEYKPEEKIIKFDTQPLSVSVTYVPNKGATYLTEDSTIFTNDYPTIKVSVTDNYLDELEASDLKLQWLTNGTDHEFEKSEFTLNEDGSAYELEFVVGESISDAELETIRNTFVYSGSDHAKNGANVTIDYGTESIVDQGVSINGDADASVTTTTPLVVDKVAPKYTMNIVNPLGEDNKPVDGSVHNNRVYYGENTVSQLAPTVSITEGNFTGDDYEFATVYSDGGNNYEEADVDVTSTNWTNFAADSKNISFPKQDGDKFSDGVYRFAVRGTDKAGNLLVPSEEESTHVNELTTSPIADTNNAYWTNVKVVDTKIDLYLGISDPDADDKYFEHSTLKERVVEDLYRQKQSADIIVSANVDDIVEKSPTKISMRVDSTNAEASGTFGTIYENEFGYGDLEHRLPVADQKFLIKDVIVTDRAGNTAKYSMETGDTVYLDVTNPTSGIDITAPSIKVHAETPITIRNTEDNRPLFNTAVNLRVDINDPNPEYCSGIEYVTYTLYADGNVIFTQRRNAGDDHYSDRATFSEMVVADPKAYAALETNNIELVVQAVDNSGNTCEERETFGIDTVAPVVEISFDNNSAQHDKYFKENRVATVKVTDRNINTSLIEVHTSVGHSAFSAIQNGGGNGANDYRTFTIPYTEDGDYTLNITGTDALGNRFDRPIFVDGTVAGSDFTIDKTTPVINVSFNNNDVRNGKYYNAARVATVTIDEHNFLADEVTIDQTASIQRGSTGAPSPSGFGTSGDTHTATINYAADGNYTLTVSYTDMAGNEAEQVVVPEFTIDTTKPVVRFDENTVTDNMATNGVIAPSVIFDDTNFDANGISVTLTGARVDNHNHPFTRTVTQFGSVVTFSDFARVKESDDIYTAKATITDLAGNTAEATVRFSVNRFGSTFDFNDDENTMDLVDSYYAQETGNVIIREVNVNKLTGYTLTVNRDGSNVTLVEGEDFRVISSAIAGGYQYIYEIFPDVFGSEGTYSIIVQSVDEAGNTNTNSTVRTDDGVNDYPVVFAIDKTLPTVSIDELDPDDRSNNNFNENTKTFRVSVRDNNALARVIVTVDGNVVFDMDGQELAEYLEEHGGFVEITLDASSGYQTIKVQAFDGAGNESADTQYQVLVTTNFFVRFFYNKPLFYGSIVFLILLLLAIAYYIKKRMDKQKENA